MIAVDTNVLLRALTQDDSGQAAVASRLLTDNPVWVSKTVLLETVWVLRTTYGFSSDAISKALADLLGLENVSVEDDAQVEQTLALSRLGLDFADAIHVSSTPSGMAFVTFDKALATRARRAGVSSVVLLTSKS